MTVSAVLIAAIAVVVVPPIFLLILFKTCWRVAGPSEAGIITGFGIKGTTGDGSDAFRIVSGGGKIVLPVLQRWETLSLAQHSAQLRVDAVDQQKIATGTSGVVLFKINDDPMSITNAARRYLDGSEALDANVREVFQGQVRSILGSLTIEQLIEDRALLARKVREACDTEMQSMGLKIDSLQISEIHDPSGYIAALGAPQTAQVKMRARIAEAERDREATEVAKLQASKTEQELRSTIVKQAEAEATQTRVRADAQRDAKIAAADAEAAEREKLGVATASATRATGEAEASALQAKGLAEANALHARAEALAENQEAVIGQQIAEQMPAIVEAAAGAFRGVDNLTVLNGAQGMSEILNQIIAQAGSSMQLAQQLLTNTKTAAGGVKDGSAKLADNATQRPAVKR